MHLRRHTRPLYWASRLRWRHESEWAHNIMVLLIMWPFKYQTFSLLFICGPIKDWTCLDRNSDPHNFPKIYFYKLIIFKWTCLNHSMTRWLVHNSTRSLSVELAPSNGVALLLKQSGSNLKEISVHCKKKFSGDLILKYSGDGNIDHLNTGNIWIPNFLKFGFQMVRYANGWSKAISYVLDRPFKYRTST